MFHFDFLQALIIIVLANNTKMSLLSAGDSRFSLPIFIDKRQLSKTLSLSKSTDVLKDGLSMFQTNLTKFKFIFFNLFLFFK